MKVTGADIIELGIPYSDPLADGPVIQVTAHETARSFSFLLFPLVAF